MKLTIRPVAPEDIGGIFDSWSKSFLGLGRSTPRGRGPLAHVPRQRYFEGQGRVMETIVYHPDTRIKVALLEGMLVGWVCGAPSRRLLHFVYVWQLYRRAGVATALMGSCFAGRVVEAEPLALTHWTDKAKHYLQRWNLVYDPFALFDVVGVQPGASWMIRGEGYVQAIDHTSRVVMGEVL